MTRKTLTTLCAPLVLVACKSSEPPPPESAAAGAGAGNTADLNAFFEEVFQERLAQSPERQTYLGIKDGQDRWDDLSPAQQQRVHEGVQRDLEQLRSEFALEELSAQEQISYRLFEYKSEDELGSYRWRLHDYPVNQMHGIQSDLISLLINAHRLDSSKDAKAYLARLRGIGLLLEQLRANLVEGQELGVLPPAFVFPMVLGDCRNITAGAPFVTEAGAPDSVLLADFRGKVEGLEELTPEQRAALIAKAEMALVEVVGPAYAALIQLLEDQQAVATEDDGIWKLPDGGEYYAWLLRHHTSTELTPDEVHELGLTEVARIQAEMRAIMAQVGFEGDLQAFFTFLRDDERFYYEDSEAGRAAYLADATEIIDTMEARMGEAFSTRPQSELVVKAVEPYRAASAGKAFYDQGAPDGSRPGTYYANLYEMRDMPTYQMEALAYHEGVPGHHMQVSLAMELEDVPQFRRFGQYTAYGEGWGLYTERLPKELGFYSDPYSDFGRLAMELWRACRLVVDSGIHHLRWTRQEAIDYLLENTPNPEGDCVKAIERYIVMPGQATAYMVGMLEILRLRAEAREALGEEFELSGFHDVVLLNGAVPLPILEELVQAWVTSQTSAGS